MSQKFGKNRGVDWRYLHVPLKYQETIKSTERRYDEWGALKLSNKKEVAKDLVIVDDYGKILVCAVRNDITCRSGRTFTCKKIFKKNGVFFEWKGKMYKYSSRSGWVL